MSRASTGHEAICIGTYARAGTISIINMYAIDTIYIIFIYYLKTIYDKFLLDKLYLVKYILIMICRLSDE